MTYRFEKMHGLGNDFMLLDARQHQDSVTLPPASATIRHWADRHTGIGFDQLIFLDSGSQGLHYYFYNADGSQAQQCGNGQRAIALYLQSRNELVENATVYGAGGPVSLHYKDADHIAVTMKQAYRFEAQTLKVGAESMAGYFVDVGNPHWLYVCEDVADENLSEKAAQIAANFPQGVNVEAVQIRSDRQLNIRIYERGAGETLACGSGACAVAVVAHHLWAMAKKLAVVMPGGSLQIELSDDCDTIRFIGPARRVYQGVINE